jgi:hypothetical protein
MTLSRNCVAGFTLLLIALLYAPPLPAQESRWNELNAQVLVLYQQGKYTEALPIAAEALKVAEATFGPDDARVAITLNNLAMICIKQGRYAEAESLFQHALRIDEEALGPDHSDVARDLNNLALLYVDQGRYAEAEPLYQRALRIRENALGHDHPHVAYILGNLPGPPPPPPTLATVQSTEIVAPIERYPNIEAPDTVIVGQEIAVQVSLTAQQISPETKILSGAQNKGKLQLQMAEGEHQWTLTVNLTVPGMEIIPSGLNARDIILGGSNTQEITIERNGDSTIAAFYLRALPLNPAANGKRDTHIFATLWHEGAFLARIARPLTIFASASQAPVADQATPLSATPAPSMSHAHAALPMLDSASSRHVSLPVSLDPSVIAPNLTIIENRNNNSLHITYCIHERGTETWDYDDIANPDDLHAWINAHFAQMSTLGRGFGNHVGNPAQPNPEQLHASDYLNAFGAELYDRFAPQEFKKLFFDLIQRSPEGKSISIQILSDDPAIPWELMRPSLPGGNNRMDFLGATFSIARWPMSHSSSSRPPQSLAVQNSVVVAPSYRGGQTLTAANQELDTLKTIHGFTQVEGNYAAMRQIALNPPQGIVHFAGHGAVYDKYGVPQFAILLEDAEMDPATWRSLGDAATATHPLFFFNACDVGESRQFMNEVDGWAPALLANGASGYIGALWPVSDSTAALFASTFYAALNKSLASDYNLNVASLLALTRAQVYRNTGDVTALAYVFYGDPKLILTSKPQATNPANQPQLIPR